MSRTAAILLWLAPAAALAQLASDEVPHERTVPENELIQKDMEESPYRLGPFRVHSRLVLRNTGYDSNVFGASENPVGSWTGQAGVGIHAILPVGAKTYFVADALPSYVWFTHPSGANTLGGFYRGAMDAFFNHLTGEAAVYDSKSPDIVSSETEVQALQHISDGSAHVELALTRAISVFASGEVQKLRYTNGSEPLPPELSEIALLDRQETASRAGVRYRFAPNFDVSAVAEGTRTSFVVNPAARDNKSHAYLGGIHYDAPHFYVNVSGGYRNGGLCSCLGAFPSYSTGTGSYFLSVIPASRLELQAWGHRGISYSVFESGPYYIETRNGGGPAWHATSRVTIRAWGEYGTNAYPLPVEVQGAGQVVRLDKATSFGGGVSYAVFKNGSFGVLATRTRYDSNIPTFNRSVFRVTAGITYEGEIPR